MMDYKKWLLTDRRKEIIKKRLTAELKNVGLKYNAFMNSKLLEILETEVKIAIEQINNTHEEEKVIPQFPDLSPSEIRRKNTGTSVVISGNTILYRRKGE